MKKNNPQATPPRIFWPKTDEAVLQKFVVSGDGHARYDVRATTPGKGDSISTKMEIPGHGWWDVRITKDFPDNQFVKFDIIIWKSSEAGRSPTHRVWMHRPARIESPVAGTRISLHEGVKGTGGIRNSEIRLVSEDGQTVYGRGMVSDRGTWEIRLIDKPPEGKCDFRLVQDQIGEGERAITQNDVVTLEFSGE
ncbi:MULTISPECIES: hypothetical protein [Pseudomonas]|uniref:Uncharacterized protein n=1 Tax=Pseudomonas glycinae TaxID=1785145 RepID=A0ABM5ZMA0_9PSED|nr:MULTISPECIES: hypothetical protein [Pseudomonas]AMQ84801.1 hypothetical protein AWU82_16275 [Pseudomonas glycinae]NKF27893.1 hypothetical protein [Pseudomonas sp. BG5]